MDLCHDEALTSLKWMFSRSADHTKWIGAFQRKQDFIDVVEVWDNLTTFFLDLSIFPMIRINMKCKLMCSLLHSAAFQ